MNRSLLAGTAFVALAAMLTAGCMGTRGEGPTVPEPRPLAAFSRVDSAAGIDVTIQIGPAQAIEVRAQSNITPLIVTTIDGGTLRIRSTKELDPFSGVTVAITVPDLDGITLSGGSDGTVTGLAGKQFDAAITGGGDLTVTGTADAASVKASGGGEAHLTGLAIRTLDVELSGGAVVEGRVSDEVRGSASGGAEVTIAGDARLNVETSGGAEVHHG